MSQDQKKMTKKKSKKKSLRVGKYVFPTQELGLEFIDKEKENSNLIAKLGLRQQGFLVDVLWHEENEDWLEFEVNVQGEGCHQFRGYKYADPKA